MSRTQKHHHELTNGVGKCSVPMWMDGCPAGFCDDPAYGKPPPSERYYSYIDRRMVRKDGRYDGYVPGLACPGHGGPKPKYHRGDPCVHCGVAHDDVPSGPCQAATNPGDQQ